jgi:hypothetical protein
MTPEQFKKAIDNLGLTEFSAATLFGVHPRTTRRWANAERKVPPPVHNFLRYLVEHTGKTVSKPKRPKVKDRAGPTFVAAFADGEVTRMTVFTSLTNLDVGRGLRLSQAAYEARARRLGRLLHPTAPPIVRAHFERDGEVLATYDNPVE